MATNLRGVWSCLKFELRQMRKQGSGAIVNCSSLGGLVGAPGRGTYHAAKHGVIGVTRSAALEYAAKGIRINAICPGVIHTPMVDQMMAAGQTEALSAMLKDVPIGRFGRPARSRMLFSGFAAPPQAWWSATHSWWTAGLPYAEENQINRTYTNGCMVKRCNRQGRAARCLINATSSSLRGRSEKPGLVIAADHSTLRSACLGNAASPTFHRVCTTILDFLV